MFEWWKQFRGKANVGDWKEEAATHVTIRETERDSHTRVFKGDWKETAKYLSLREIGKTAIYLSLRESRKTDTYVPLKKTIDS